MIRMQAPEGMSSFSHQGHKIDIDGDGVVMLDERHRADFESHGFRDVGAAPLAAAAVVQETDPRRSAAIDEALRLFTEALGLMSVEDIERNNAAYVEARERRASYEAETPDADGVDEVGDAPPQEPEPAPADTPRDEGVPARGRLTDAQIDRMSKAQMTAWLREREIPMNPPIDNDMLRAKVRAANADD